MQLTPEQQKALEAQKEQCPFCKIIKGEIPCKKVYEDDKVIAILDINPATKGHTLVMPKEHYPIMPLIPPEDFEYLSVKTRQLSKAIKEGMLVFGTNIFIANGAAAGQQSQHFMLHIIPREEGDMLSAFEFEKIDIDKVKTEEAFSILSKRLPRLLSDVYKRFPLNEAPQPKISYTKAELLKIIDMNPQLKQAIIKNPLQFKQMIPSNPQLKQLFDNINVDEIIENVTGKKMTDMIQKDFRMPELPQPKKEESSEEKDDEGNEDDAGEDEEVDIFKVLEQNPKLKKALIENPEVLKQKIDSVPELKEWFKDMDIPALRKEVLKRDMEKNMPKKIMPNGTSSEDIADLL